MNKPTTFQQARTFRLAALALALAPLAAPAQTVVVEDLSNDATTYPWKPFGGACLTARPPGAANASTIPGCVGLPAYAGSRLVGGAAGVLPDAPGRGALRLTNGDTVFNGTNSNFSTGAVLSDDNGFQTSKGMQVRFWTQTYGGNGHAGKGLSASDGADGIAFILTDGTLPKPSVVGASGGALGYACAHDFIAPLHEGIAGGYLGIGIDEYGNFSNPAIIASDGPGRFPASITVRGPGSITYQSLNARYPVYYPLTLTDAQKADLIEATCRTGKVQSATGLPVTDSNNNPIPISNYPLLGTQRLADLVPPGKPAIPLANQQVVPQPKRDLANIFKFDLSITPANNVNLSYTINDGYSITLLKDRPVPTLDGQTLPAFMRYGFTSSTGAGSNVHEIACFAAGPLDSLAQNSAGVSGKQSQKVQAGSQAYLAFYHPKNSWGQLTASNLVTDAAGKVSLSDTANWDAHCVLTGGACAATGNPGNASAQAPASRQILSWNGSSGVPLAFGSLAAADQAALGGTTDGAARLNYLRGDRSREIVAGAVPTKAGTVEFRHRDGVLGDIVNSSPVWVGGPDLPYATAGRDLLKNQPVTEFGSSYTKFMEARKGRTNVVYAGANDGMLHAFRAGARDAAGAFVTTQNDGLELMAFMPQAVVNTIHSGIAATDFTALPYAHNSYVDATPATGDLYYGGAWHTWLVGGLGGGGNATIVTDGDVANGVLYALDITDPAKFGTINSDAASAAALVVGEWHSGPGVLADLGSVYGTPLIRRLHDGNWAVIFGNGRNSKKGRAGVYVMTVAADGTRSFRFLDTGLPPNGKNGIDYVSSADLDGDHVTDYLYAGDSTGSVWRFDLTDSNAALWGKARRIFTTEGGQPISTAVLTTSLADTGAGSANRVMVSFGTGRVVPQTLTSAAIPAAGGHALYGVWDWDMTDWNSRSPVRYASLPRTGVALPGNTVADLQRQTITSEVRTTLTPNQLGSQAAVARIVSQNKICWRDLVGCSGGKIGWQLPLSVPANGPGEQIIANPVFAYDTFFVNTLIPAPPTNQCTPELPSGFTMAISLATGGAPTSSVFATASTAAGFNAGNGVISGLALGATGTPSIVTAAGKPYLVQQTTAQKNAAFGTVQNAGIGKVTQIDPPPKAGKRLTWTRLR